MSNEELVTRIKAGVDVADNMLALWQQCQKFITMLAKRFTGWAELEDLEQEGYFGLCAAVNNYDCDRSTPFINYSAFWIRQYMKRYIDNCCGAVRLPVHAKEKLRQYKRTVAGFKREYGRGPADKEICSLLQISREQLEQLRNDEIIDQVKSLDAAVPGDEGKIAPVDMVASDQEVEEDVIHDLDSQRLKAEMTDILNDLEGQQSAVIYSRFYQGRTLKETGQQLGASPERVRQLQTKALRELRQPKYRERLLPYVDDRLSVAAYHHVGISQFDRTWTSVTEYAALALMGE